MTGNSNLNNAHRNKADEFYTPLPFIEKELRHYKEHFRGKTVLCNCDDPYESEFFKYFVINFRSLGLKKLITTCYAASSVTGKELPFQSEKRAYKVEITEIKDETGDGRVGLADIEYLLKNKELNKKLIEPLDGDGDFRSDECVKLLEEADIVVTNPPFSLFRDFISLLIDKEKEFLIIGNMNAVTCKNIFPFIRDNKVWLGYNNGCDVWFKVPDIYEEKKTCFKIDENNQKWRRVGKICWFTNLSVEKHRENILLFKKYSPELYSKYDNYDAINVDKVADIPCDYYGVMGVPITFIQYYNPDQFEIVGQTGGDTSPEVEILKTDAKYRYRGRINGKTLYARLLIKRRKLG